MPILYTTQSTATGGRTGSAKTADGRLSVVLDTPKELGGQGGEGTNPELAFCFRLCCLLSRGAEIRGGERKDFDPR